MAATEEPESTTVKLAICEDDQLFRTWAVDHFTGLGTYEVRAAADLEELLQLIETSWIPEVVLFDLYIRRQPQFDAARRIRERAPNAKVLTLTYSSFDGDVRRALERQSSSAFDGYLTKDISPAEMDVAIKQVMSGVRYIDPKVGDDAIPDPLRDLTGSERRVLQGLADGLTPHEIAKLLPRNAKTGLQVGDRQVRRLAESATAKLGARSVPEAISIAHRRHLVA